MAAYKIRIAGFLSIQRGQDFLELMPHIAHDGTCVDLDSIQNNEDLLIYSAIDCQPDLST